MTDISLSDIERLCASYSEQRRELADRVAELQARIDALTREYLPSIRVKAAAAQAARDGLQSYIEAAPELFTRPKTRIFSGVKVGYQTGKPRVEIPDEAETIRRIRAQLPEAQAELLIAVTERVDKRAVADLTTADLKRLRIRVEPGAEQIVIRPVDSDVDRIVKALLDDAARLEKEAGA